MSPRKRTLCFFLILLWLNNDFGFVAGSPVGPSLTEHCPFSGSPPQLVNSLLTATAGSGNRVSPEVQQKFPTQQFNDVFSFSYIPPGVSIDNNYGVIKHNPYNTNPYNTLSACSPFETSNSLPVVERVTESLHCPSNVESLTVVQNYPPVTRTIQVDGCAPTANVAEFYQTPITVQIPSMPQLSPFVGVASPLPEKLPSQNIIQELYNPNVAPKIYCPQTIETSAPVVPNPTSNIPSSGLGCGGQQAPVALQINMASPWSSEPVRAAISQPPPAPRPSPSFDPSFSMPPAPIIVVEKSKSTLESILPILLLNLIDGGGGNNGGGGECCGYSQCSAIPVPFPVLIPFNNPVIIKKKSKTDPKSGDEPQK